MQKVELELICKKKYYLNVIYLKNHCETNLTQHKYDFLLRNVK